MANKPKKTKVSKSKKRADRKHAINPAPDTKTVRTWLRRLSDGGFDPIALRDRRHCDSGNFELQLNKAIRDAIATAADGYKSENRPTIEMCFNDLETAVRALNAKRIAAGEAPYAMPSRKALAKKIHDLPQFDVYASRRGLEAAQKYFGLVQGPTAGLRPGDRVETDEFKLPLQSVLEDVGVWALLSDKDKKGLVGRYWLCGALDTATKCILGLWIASGPTTELAMTVLQQVVSDKSWLARLAGCVTPWDMVLSPDTVVTDGGKALTSEEFIAAISDLKATHETPPAGSPKQRGGIERLFGTAHKRIIAYFSGRSFDDHFEKGDYDSQGRASVFIEHLMLAVIRWAVDDYHNQPHAGLGGETPRNSWLRQTGLFGVVPTGCAPCSVSNSNASSRTKGFGSSGCNIPTSCCRTRFSSAIFLRRKSESTRTIWAPSRCGLAMRGIRLRAWIKS